MLGWLAGSWKGGKGGSSQSFSLGMIWLGLTDFLSLSIMLIVEKRLGRGEREGGKGSLHDSVGMYTLRSAPAACQGP